MEAWYIQVLNMVAFENKVAEVEKFLSIVQVLLNVYLKVLKNKYSCTWSHAQSIMITWQVYKLYHEIMITLALLAHINSL